jgi:RNA polymerase nonessential primary-like sigma factor
LSLEYTGDIHEDVIEDEPRLKGDARVQIYSLDEVAPNIDLTKVYLDKIGKIALLKAEDEVELAKDIEAGLYAQNLLEQERFDSAEEMQDLQMMREIGEWSKNAMIEANLRLVVSFAKRYSGRGMPYLDLIQEGNVELINAVQKFDYEKGYKFSTFATQKMWPVLVQSMFKQARTLPISRTDGEKWNKYKNIGRKLEQELGRTATDQEVADKAGISVDTLQNFFLKHRDALSYDVEVGETQNETLADFIAESGGHTPEEVLMIQLMIDDVNELLTGLSKDEQVIMRGQFGFNAEGKIKTFREIGKELRIPDNEASSKYEEIMAKLQNDPQLQELREYLL